MRNVTLALYLFATSLIFQSCTSDDIPPSVKNKVFFQSYTKDLSNIWGFHNTLQGPCLDDTESLILPVFGIPIEIEKTFESGEDFEEVKFQLTRSDGSLLTQEQLNLFELQYFATKKPGNPNCIGVNCFDFDTNKNQKSSFDTNGFVTLKIALTDVNSATMDKWFFRSDIRDSFTFRGYIYISASGWNASIANTEIDVKLSIVLNDDDNSYALGENDNNSYVEKYIYGDTGPCFTKSSYYCENGSCDYYDQDTPTNGSFGPGSSYLLNDFINRVTNFDITNAPKIGFEREDETVEEDVGAVIVKLTLDKPAIEDSYVYIEPNTSNEPTAISGENFNINGNDSPPHSIFVAQGGTEVTFTINVIDNTTLDAELYTDIDIVGVLGKLSINESKKNLYLNINDND